MFVKKIKFNSFLNRFGLVIYTLVFVELGLGLLSIWGLAAIVSVNQGYPRIAKRIHQFFGAILLLASW
jgi:hypothetical protein